MFDVFGSKVIDLKRVRIGSIKLTDLKLGNYQKFNKKDMEFVNLIKK